MKRQKETLRVMNKLVFSIVVIVSQVYTDGETCHTTHDKYLQFMYINFTSIELLRKIDTWFSYQNQIYVLVSLQIITNLMA